MRENFRARGSMNDLKTFFFWCKKQPVVVSFFSAKNKRKKKTCDLSLSLSPKKEFERERGGTRAANTHEKSFGRANVARQKPRAVERVCKMSKGQNEMREFRKTLKKIEESKHKSKRVLCERKKNVNIYK